MKGKGVTPNISSIFQGNLLYILRDVLSSPTDNMTTWITWMFTWRMEIRVRLLSPPQGWQFLDRAENDLKIALKGITSGI